MKIRKKIKNTYIFGGTVVLLVAFTLISALILSIPTTTAVSEQTCTTTNGVTTCTRTASASVTVSSSCTMTTTAGSGGTATTGGGGYTYSASINPGNSSEIAGSILTTSCNGLGDYSLYAIGYGNDSYTTPTNTQMISSTGANNIVTGTATSGNTSNWAFKLASVTGTTAPTIVNAYSSYTTIPDDDFAKVAYAPGTTGTAATTAVQPKYQVFITSAQPAATYTGKVKYTMVFPNGAPAPTPPPTPPGYCTDTTTCMQTLSTCPTVATTVTDARDGKTYRIQQLNDGNCWMLDNLALNPVALTYNQLYGVDNYAGKMTNASSTALNYLKNGGGSGQYPRTAVSSYSNWPTSSSSYYTPAINANYVDTVPSGAPSGGAGSNKVGVYYNYCAASAGTFCYENNSGTYLSEGDICPYSWRLPTGGSSSEAEYIYVTAYSSNPTNFKNALSLPLSGVYLNSSPQSQGVNGNWWSRSTLGSIGNGAWIFDIDSSSVSVNHGQPRYSGYSIRCMSTSF